MKTQVIFVDDDPMVLASTRRQLRSKLANCNLEFFTCAADALMAADCLTPDIVFSDMRMPEMDGPQFLRRIAQSHPSTARFAWTGESDIQQVKNEFRVAHQVIAKPCPAEHLIEIVKTTSKLRDRLRSTDLLPLLTSPDQSVVGMDHLQIIQMRLDNSGENMLSLAAFVDESSKTKKMVHEVANGLRVAHTPPITDTTIAISTLGVALTKAVLLASYLMHVAKQTSSVLNELQCCFDLGIVSATRFHELSQCGQLDQAERNAGSIAAMFHNFGKAFLATLGEIETPYDFRHELVTAYTLSVWGIAPNVCELIATMADNVDHELIHQVLRDATTELIVSVERGE